jgi:hypothetical protein
VAPWVCSPTAGIEIGILLFNGGFEMAPLEEYLEHADKLAREVVNTWAFTAQAGDSGFLIDQLKVLFDKACLYQTARGLADNHREHNMLRKEEEAEETATRQAFAEAYKAFYERHAGAS